MADSPSRLRKQTSDSARRMGGSETAQRPNPCSAESCLNKSAEPQLRLVLACRVRVVSMLFSTSSQIQRGKVASV